MSLDALVAVARPDDANAAAEVAEKVFATLPDADNAVHPGQDARVLKRLDGLGNGRAGAAGALGDLLIGREAKAAAGAVEAPQQGFKDCDGPWR
jgi:hypothetical protein